jgi:AcrR family transcriptional regulator
MVQVKKPEARAAILASAYERFSQKGFAATTMTDIAREADMSTGNVYIYFNSKLEILYAIYDPWLRARVKALEIELARIKSPNRRLQRLLGALWRDIPAEDNGFLNNIIQAISSATPAEGYQSTLVRWFEQRIAAIILGALPPRRQTQLKNARIAHLLIMAFDGFAIQRHLHPRTTAVDEATIKAIATMLIGEPA